MKLKKKVQNRGIISDFEIKYEEDETDPLAIPGGIKVEPGKHY